MRLSLVALLLLALLFAHPLLVRHPRARSVAADLLAAAAIALSPGAGWATGWRVALPLLLVAAAFSHLRAPVPAAGAAAPAPHPAARLAVPILAALLAGAVLVVLRGSPLAVVLAIAACGLCAATVASRTTDQFGALSLGWTGLVLAAWLVPAAGPLFLLLVLSVRVPLELLLRRALSPTRSAGPQA